jgi:hypothetical protein
MRGVPILLIALLGIAAALPAAASGQDNSAIDQYTENVPGAGGDSPDGGNGSGQTGTGTGGSDATLPGADADQLQAQGADGEAAAQLAESTAPAGSNQSGGSSNATGVSTAPDNQHGANSGGLPSVGAVVGNVAGGAEGPGGMGVWLPIILGASLLAAIALGIARWRRGPGEPTHA